MLTRMFQKCVFNEQYLSYSPAPYPAPQRAASEYRRQVRKTETRFQLPGREGGLPHGERGELCGNPIPLEISASHILDRSSCPQLSRTRERICHQSSKSAARDRLRFPEALSVEEFYSSNMAALITSKDLLGQCDLARIQIQP